MTKDSIIKKAAILAIGFAALCFSAAAEKLVILHTNDTHSAIEPNADGTGGILQRKAVIDSVRSAEKNVIMVDAGDVVQGSLYFKYFRGDVEYPLLNMVGYDICILGNHEFDNGMADLAEKYKTVKGAKLTANYDFTGTELEGVLEPYVIKKVKGKKIGFFGINVNPESLIAHKNISVNFKDPITTANEVARILKHEKDCDLVVAVTHLGYEKENENPTDVELANASRDIDIIIGGHSHTLINPANPEEYPSLIKNADGKNVRVVQTGKGGKYLGKLTIDLDNLKGVDGADFAYDLIPVTNRFPSEVLNKEMIEFLKPYKACVDSVNARVIGKAAYGMSNSERTGAMANMTADFGYWYGNHKADSLRKVGIDVPRVDMAIMNVGGIRQEMPEGDITEGQILSTYPFSNHFLIVSIKGQDIIDALSVASRKGGEAISGNVRVVTDNDGNLIRVVIDGEEMEPEKTYYIGTIDYVAEGNDDLRTLANHQKVWFDDEEVAAPMLRWFVRKTELGLPIAPDQRSRFIKSL